LTEELPEAARRTACPGRPGRRSTTQPGPTKGGMAMAVKVLIKRRVPQDKGKSMVALFRQMRTLANEQEGYISGETLRSLEKPDEFLVISSWQSSKDWNNWVASAERKRIQAQIDQLLGGQTTYEIYHYGFTE
jgi:heme-degrading monooxygenase HmoA